MLEYLRTHVVGRACERGGQVRRSHEDSGDTKVTQFNQIILEEDVSVQRETKAEGVSNIVSGGHSYSWLRFGFQINTLSQIH